MTDREHIEQLAAELGIELHWDAEEFRAQVDILNRIAYLEPLRGDGEYATALHELGHVAAEQPGRSGDDIADFLFGRTPEARVTDEAYAWRWAIQQARERRELSEEFRLHVASGMGSYFLHSGIFPEDEHADVVREVVEAAGDVSFPQWPKTNAAWLEAREAYLGVSV